MQSRTTKTNQNNSFAPQLNPFQPTPFGVDTPQQSETSTTERDIDAEYERAKNAGKNCTDIPPLFPPEPPAIPNIQAKLSIGQPNDKYEQEADNVATEVVNKINTPSSTSATDNNIQTQVIPYPNVQKLQRQTENTIQTQAIPYPNVQKLQRQTENTIQTQVIPYPNVQKLQRQTEQRQTENIHHPRPLNLSKLQRVENPKNISQQNNQATHLPLEPFTNIQRKQENTQIAKNDNLENTIQSKKGSGQEIAADVREPMEQAFGADFSSVRVHTDGESDQLNQSLNAKAFATGQDVFFRQGAYNPTSRDGQHLLAHELTHVVQQNGSAVQRKIEPQEQIQSKSEPEIKVEKLSLSGQESEVQRLCDECAAETTQKEGIIQTKGIEDTNSTQSLIAAPTTETTPEIVPDFNINDPEIPQESKKPIAPESTEDQAKIVNSPKGDKSQAEQAIEQTEPGKIEQKKNEVMAAKQPEVDKTTEQLPQVEETAKQAAQEAEKPSQPIVPVVEEKEPSPEEKPTTEANVEQSAGMADQAFSMANAESAPAAPPEAIPPQPVAATPTSTSPIPSNPEADAAINNLIQQAQSLRQGGHQLLAQAAEVRSNAQILTGNIQLIKQGIAQSEQGVTKSTSHLQFRQETVLKAKQALQVSKQKAAKVAKEAPSFTEKANQGSVKTSPMASKAADLVGQNASKTPKDPEAAGKTQEQGQKLNKVASDTTKINDAFSQTKAKATSLTQEATQATALNTQTGGKIQQMDQTLGQSQQKLSQMTSQNTEAKTQVQGLETQPEEMLKQAAELEQKGQALIQASMEMEKQVQQTQAEYNQAMSNLPESQAAQDSEQGSIQRKPEEGRYEDRINVDLVGGMPSWLSGENPQSDQQKQKAVQEAEEKRQKQIEQINQMAGGHFESLSAGDKIGMALKLTGQNISASLSKIQWPSFKDLLVGLIDPRSSIKGVLSGLSQMLSGGANLFSAEQRAKDPLGNFLKSAADIATGLTVVLGSITALAAIITGLMTALTIVSLGIAAPITGPIIAFSASVMVTVGGWTFVTGLVAAGLQALVFIKNLVDAATAKTAEDLQNQSDQMTQDVSNAGNALLQAGMGKLAQVGGRQLQSGIAEAGGGVRFAAKMGAEGLPARVVTGVKESGGVGTYARGVAGNVGRNVTSSVKAVGTAIEEQGLGGFAGQTAGKAWGGVKSTAKEAWKGLTAKGESPVPGRQGFSRDFLVGKDIPEGGLTAAANETRAATTNKLIEEMRVRGEIPARAESTVPASETHSGKSTELLENTANKTGKELTPPELTTETPKAELPDDLISGATSRQKFDLTDGNWKDIKFSNPDEGIVYVLRDKATGEILKVGKSEVSTIETSRIAKYAKASRETGKPLEIEIFTVPESSSTFESVEGQARQILEKGGHSLPWDQTGQRLGREGPGVPGTPLPKRLREKGWRWKWPEGILVDGNGNPVRKQP